MLEDWEPGQILQFGNKIYTQWRAGMASCWEWSHFPTNMEWQLEEKTCTTDYR